MIADILGVLFLAGIGSYFLSGKSPELKPAFNIQEGKSRSLQAKGDASLHTELLRRRTIQRVGRLDYSKIKESRTQFGSTTGAIETFMITGIGNLPKQGCVSDIIYDGGGQSGEYCPVPGSGTFDAGNQNTRVCESCPPDIIYDAGNQSANFCQIHGSGTLDAGDQNTKSRGV